MSDKASSRNSKEDLALKPLVYNVATFLREPAGATRYFTYDEPELDLEAEPGQYPNLATDLEGEIKFTRVQNSILAQGAGSCTVEIECSRCLRIFSLDTEFVIEDIFRPSVELATGRAVAEMNPEEEADFKIDSYHMLNLGEAIRQEIIVSLPLNPLHSPDCTGLQEVLDRINETSTIPDVVEVVPEEAPEIIDPRWAALAPLLEKSDENTSKPKRKRPKSN